MTAEVEEQGTQAPYTITLKGGAGYEQPWLVVRAESAEDAVALLAEAALAELPEKIAEYAQDFRTKNSGGGSAKESQSTGATSSRRSSGGASRGASRGSSRPAAQKSEPEGDVELHPEGVECQCGEPVRYKKINSRGREFELWVCPNQRTKGDNHFSEFIN